MSFFKPKGSQRIRKESPLAAIVSPFAEFARLESAGGYLLVAAAILGIYAANGTMAELYSSLLEMPVSISAGKASLTKPLILWINDGLMAVFFLMVGLEIKREVLTGELSSPSKAALPLVAALGGMAVPAGFYILFNTNGEGAVGWGIPMATDIAFALGVLTLLGRRVPVSLKIFLTALAIFDDIGAIIVIAAFYTDQISTVNLITGLALLGFLGVLARLRVYSLKPYLIIGSIVWLMFLQSGVHATVAGVLLAMVIPSRPKIMHDRVCKRANEILNEYGCETMNNEEHRQSALAALENLGRYAMSPLTRLERALHPFVTYFVLPLFALGNAGVSLEMEKLQEGIGHPVFAGVFAGLVLGKPIGVALFTFVAVKLKICVLPANVTNRHIIGAGLLAGIGFTMSLFINGLAFDDFAIQYPAKVAILVASLVSGILGTIVLLTAGKEPPVTEAS